MANVLRTLFGGSKNQATQQTQSTSLPTDMTPDAYKNLQDPLSQALSSLLTTGGPEYTGPLAAPLGANEQANLNDLMSMTGPNTARSQLLDKTLQGDFLPGQAGANPFLDAAIKAAQRPTLQGLTETLTRDLPGRFTANGQFVQPNTGGEGGSSAFDRAAAVATRGAADAIGDIATKISYQGYNDERQRQQDAVPLSRAEVDSTVTNLQAQALPRLIQQLGIDNGLQLFQQRTQALLQILQTIGGVAAPVIANTGQSTGGAYSTGTSDKGVIPGLFPATGFGGGAAPNK